MTKRYKVDPTIKIYDKFLAEGNADHQKVGWGSAESQRKRFEVLSGLGNLDGCSILDVGCGIGGLYEYLSSIYTELNYTGVDINQGMLKMAANRHPELSFICTDLLAESNLLKNSRFDYVFLSGALNLSHDNQEQIIRDMMAKMFLIANKGIALNFLSVFSDFYKAGEYYSNPEKILQSALKISRKVVLRHDYMPHDFSIYIYK
jgi:SAM-dependent methyltransferase